VATLKRLKTLLLGLAVIIITFTIFIVLPTQLPPAKSISCEKVIWACSKRGPPVKYDTVIWDEPKWPTMEIEAPFGKIPIPVLPFSGKMLVEEDPDNKEKITVSGYLMYATKEEPENEGFVMPGLSPKGGLWRRTIMLEVRSFYGEESVVEEVVLFTDRDGFFSTDIEFEEVPDCYTIYARYEEEIIVPQDPKLPVKIYFGCGADFNTCKYEMGEGPLESQWWFWLIVVVVVLGLGYLCYWYIRRRRRRPTIKVPEAGMEAEIEEGLVPEEGEEKEPATGGDMLRIEISFLQIEGMFPDVWGAGEPLSVFLRFKDDEGNTIPSQPGEIDWGDGETVQATVQAVTNGEGQIQVEYAYNIKGEYIIGASYMEIDTGKQIFGRREIRIVDYREEMVHLFNEMVSTLNIKDIRIDRKMTAREIEVLLAERMEGVSRGTIRRIVAGFEEANYSLHPVARSSYEAMYLAVSEVLKNAG